MVAENFYVLSPRKTDLVYSYIKETLELGRLE